MLNFEDQPLHLLLYYSQIESVLIVATGVKIRYLSRFSCVDIS